MWCVPPCSFAMLVPFYAASPCAHAPIERNAPARQGRDHRAGAKWRQAAGNIEPAASPLSHPARTPIPIQGLGKRFSRGATAQPERFVNLSEAQQIVLRDPGRGVGFVNNRLQLRDLAKLRAV
jgi:hypothetical protein